MLQPTPIQPANDSPQKMEFFSEEFEGEWWLEVTTDYPRCIYYFGPFLDCKVAEAHQPEFIKDLEDKDVIIIATTVKQIQPIPSLNFEPSFSNQS